MWAVRAHIDEAGSWHTDSQTPIWGHGSSLGAEQTAAGFKPKGIGEVFKVLSFGLPTMVRLAADGAVLLAFWCEEDGLVNIRTFLLHVPDCR